MESASGGGMQGIFKLNIRPQQVISQKQGETLDLLPESLQTLIYITECDKCQMILKKKPVKVVIDKCKDLVLTLCSELVSGTLEIIKSSNISINIEGEVKISTITADSTVNLQITLCQNEKQLGNLYSHQSSSLSIVVGMGEEKKEFAVTRPPHDPEYLQFISHLEVEEGVVKLITEKVVREGAYPYSEKKLNEAKEKDRQNAEKVMSFLEEAFLKPKKK